MSSHPARCTLADPHTIQSIGVDWLTATAPRTRDREALLETGRRLVSEAASIGNDVRPFKAQGYRGWASSGVAYGIRHDSFIVQLSSHDAEESWREVYPLAANVARLDLQFTVELEQARERIIRNLYARALRAKQGRGRRSEFEVRESSTSGSTLYVGRRVSDAYGRAYDKGREQKTHPAGKLIRYELQLRRKRAARLATTLYSIENSRPHLAATVEAYFRSKRVVCPSFADITVESARAEHPTDASRRMRYIKSIVAPMVSRLMEHYSYDEIVTALGLVRPAEASTDPLNTDER